MKVDNVGCWCWCWLLEEGRGEGQRQTLARLLASDALCLWMPGASGVLPQAPRNSWITEGALTRIWIDCIYRSMATTSDRKLNSLYTHFLPGTPLTSADLSSLGISADLAVYYVRSGWLVRLARGIYCRPNDPPALYPSLRLLQRRLDGLHVGGKSALDWYGIRQYVARQPVLSLYGWVAGRLPDWFTERFPATYHQKRLFDEQADTLLHVGPFGEQEGAPQVSSPERALLELLSEVGTHQPLQEARELVESAFNLRADVLQALLQCCRSVKTVRLCLQLGREVSAPWVGRLDVGTLPMGSERAWVSRSSDGLLVLKP